MKEDFLQVDDFIKVDYLNRIQDFLLSAHHEWYYMGNITNISDKNSALGMHGFNCHLIRMERPDVPTPCNAAQLLYPLILQMKEYGGFKTVLRARLDMTVYSARSIKGDPHVDLSDTPNTTAIFYVLDSDGDTLIYNQFYSDSKDSRKRLLTKKYRVRPKANRLIMFNGSRIHTGHSPSKHNMRILLNCNFN